MKISLDLSSDYSLDHSLYESYVNDAIGTSQIPNKALDKQIGGSHYKRFKIQPYQFIYENGIPYTEGCIIKYICRWREKNGIEDLEKIKHYVDLLIEMERENES
jgi:hypothetical protein